MEILNYKVLLRPQGKISRKESNRLKDRIRKRLQHEDYKCRLPVLKEETNLERWLKWLGLYT